MKVKSGIKAALPIVLGYIPVGIAFGLIANNESMPLFFTIMLSSVVFAGASQFMAVKSLALNVQVPQIMIATFLMNFRHIIMSLSIAARLEEPSKKYRPLLAFFVTDESYAVTSFRDRLDHSYLFGVQITAYLTWNISTILGYFVGSLLPSLLQQSMGITLYVLFGTLLIPELKKSKEAIVIALAAGTINTILSYLELMDPGWSLVLSIILAATIGFILFKEEPVYE